MNWTRHRNAGALCALLCHLSFLPGCALPRRHSPELPAGFTAAHLQPGTSLTLKIKEVRIKHQHLQNLGVSALSLGSIIMLGQKSDLAFEASYRTRTKACSQKFYSEVAGGVYGVLLPPVGLAATLVGSGLRLFQQRSQEKELMQTSCQFRNGTLACNHQAQVFKQAILEKTPEIERMISECEQNHAL